MRELKHRLIPASLKVEVQAPHLPAPTPHPDTTSEWGAECSLTTASFYQVEVESTDSPFTPQLAAPQLEEVKNHLVDARQGADVQVPFLASVDTTLTGEATCYPHVEGRKLSSTLGLCWYHSSRGNRQSPTTGQRVEIQTLLNSH